MWEDLLQHVDMIQKHTLYGGWYADEMFVVSIYQAVPSNKRIQMYGK